MLVATILTLGTLTVFRRIETMIPTQQAFPVGNMHSHAQPLLAYLRLLGVEPTPRGTLAVGAGGDFSSPSFALDARGHGALAARGPVTVETAHGVVHGGPGDVRW